MSYFPVFTDLNNKKIIICGGGTHALEKARKLLPFGAEITVISEKICDEINKIPKVKKLNRSFCEEDLSPRPTFVIAACDRAENERIAALCRKNNVPLNAVDMQDLCDFIFPCVISRGKLCIGISTGGASPAAAVAIKNSVSDSLPDRTEEILDWLAVKRQNVRDEIHDSKLRNKILRIMAEKSLALNRILTDDDLTSLKNDCIINQKD